MKVNQYDNIEATRDFWQASKDKIVNTCISVYANVVYQDKVTQMVLYKSAEPIQVMIDTTKENNIIIPELGYNDECFCEFWTRYQKFTYTNGILMIEGEGYGSKHAYCVSIM